MITEKEREALVWVRNCLDPEHPEKLPDWMKFDMRQWFAETSCGTNCCIGGAMDAYLTGEIADHSKVEAKIYDPYATGIGDRSRDMAKEGHMGLHRLFFNFPYSQAEPPNAVAAIDAYLSGSEFPWGVL